MKRQISVEPKELAREMEVRIGELEHLHPEKICTILGFYSVPESKMLQFDLDIYTATPKIGMSDECKIICLFPPDELDYVATVYAEQLRKSCPRAPLLKDDERWHKYVDQYREKKTVESSKKKAA